MRPRHRTPGHASAARFFGCAVRDIRADNKARANQVEFVEVLGLNAGWLVAATCLARHDPDDAPHLIYLPEMRLSLERLFDDIDHVFQRLGAALSPCVKVSWTSTVRRSERTNALAPEVSLP